VKLKIVILTVILMTVAHTSTSASDDRLEGCTNPADIQRALETLSRSDWRDISLTRVQALWPSRVDASDCESDKVCRTGWSKGRIIDNECECCELFSFDLSRNGSGEQSDQLSSVVVYYSAPRREELIPVAKHLAKAAGLADTKVGAIDLQSDQDFDWKTENKTTIQIDDINMRITSRGKLWRLYMNFGRHYDHR
jgi:hypothetical protein